MAKRKNLFKHRFTTLETPEMMIFSYKLSGTLYSLNSADGFAFISYEHGLAGYQESDIDLDIPQKNDYDKGWPHINVLAFAGFKWKEKYSPKSVLRSKIDFNNPTLRFIYAVNLTNKNQLLVLNQKQADVYIAKYPNMCLTQFIAETLKQFSK